MVHCCGAEVAILRGRERRAGERADKDISFAWGMGVQTQPKGMATAQTRRKNA